MKNYIPLVVGVVLGLVVVLMLGRYMGRQKDLSEDTSSIVIASRAISAEETLDSDMITKRSVPRTSCPKNAVSWGRRSWLLGQLTSRPIASGDYILVSDIGFTKSIGNMIGEGEWAVTVPTGGSGIAKLLQPGDEVAIIATLTVLEEVASTDMDAPPTTVERQVTTVLFPKVRVLDAGGQAAPGKGTRGEITVALPPQQAQVLISAQGKAELTLALRRPSDATEVKRSMLGKVDDGTFMKLVEGLDRVELPDSPTQPVSRKME
ncbi:MAG: Flp pilus assembly protein CpaB [Lentisphaerae bacterium]|jgi:Flp pilus assembly protein CpaB|nr:Flp pilus assembly protein CpaB [Lentisphaerota bacterium]MBT4819563.1 Flp pilus assembly protein CpaB [Lentisphaerota bacterium]MBT5604898.1 Flp pilus assembly protein CpaB [Lentisphaerota bacterium]MBT7054872.1 Flp pilus assembly protein CpaB [Lentisphaerota bacterium]MBT7842696.1 Flp pilus assembly protein CpaB [Lentisphaerota bacterium]